MNIKFKKLKVHNFLSFGDAEIDLDRNGYTIVRGINNVVDDMASSNGSGKSSIWEAIAYALVGETIRGTKDVVNINTEGGCFVELTFNVGEDEYTVIRSKNHEKYKTNLKIYINNEDKSGKGIRDSEKLLEGYLPDLTSQLVGSVIILGQGLPQRFSNNTPSGRKDVLEKLSKSDFMIADLKDRISEYKKVLSENLRTCEDAILKLNTEQTMLNNQISSDEKQIEQYSNLDSVKNDLVLFQDTLQKNQTEYEVFEKQLTEYRVSLENAQNVYNDECGKHYQELESMSETEDFKWAKKLVDDLTELQIKLKSQETELKRLQSITDVCPTCGQKLIGVEKPDTSNIEKEIEEIKLTIQSTTKECEEAEAHCQSIVTQKQTAQKILKEEFNIQSSDYKQKIADLEGKQRILKKAIDRLITDISDKQNRVDTAEEIIRTLNTNIVKNKQKVVDNDENLVYNNTMKDEICQKLEIVNKMNSIITRDFRGILLNNVIDFINKKSKEYSKDIFDTDKVEFKLDGNNISISYDNKEYENLSGGEKQKIDLIIQFALRDMLCTHLGFSSNILVLDELFDNLDDIGCQRVLNLITDKLNVESIFIITHHTTISIPYDNEIIVEKGIDKISRIVK